MLKHQAFFDVLNILLCASEFGLDLSESEIQTISYLSCLLAMYDGEKYSEWGYEYSVTSLNCPYSSDIADSLTVLERQNMINNDHGYYSVMDKTYKIYDNYSQLLTFQKRTKYTSTASSCLVDINIAEMRTAVMSFPELERNHSLKRTTMLFSEGVIDDLYKTYGELRSFLSDKTSGLLMPALLWLHYQLEGSLNEL